MQTLAKFLLCALALVVLPAAAQEPEIGQGLVCNTQAEVEKYVESFDNTRNADASLAAVNNAEYVCGILVVGFVRGEPVAVRNSKDGMLQIVEITVIAVFNGKGIVPVPPLTRFTVFIVARRVGTHECALALQRLAERHRPLFPLMLRGSQPAASGQRRPHVLRFFL